MNELIIAIDRLKRRNDTIKDMQATALHIRPVSNIRRIMLDDIQKALTELFEYDIEYISTLYQDSTHIPLGASVNVLNDLTRAFDRTDTTSERAFDQLLNDTHGICRRAKIEVDIKIRDPRFHSARLENIMLRDLHNIFDKIIYIVSVQIDDIKQNAPFWLIAPLALTVLRVRFIKNIESLS